MTERETAIIQEEIDVLKLEKGILQIELIHIRNQLSEKDKQLESMKCCGNCGIEESKNYCDIDSMIKNGVTAFICGNWELRKK